MCTYQYPENNGYDSNWEECKERNHNKSSANIVTEQ